MPPCDEQRKLAEVHRYLSAGTPRHRRVKLGIDRRLVEARGVKGALGGGVLWGEMGDAVEVWLNKDRIKLK